VHVIEERNQYAVNPGITKGAGKWLSLYRYGDTNAHNTQFCLEQLRSQGYKIVATSPHAEYSLEDLPIDQKIAIAFGTEVVGLSEHVLDYADMSVSIPMCGFTESFNIAVSSAISLYAITSRLRSSDVAWQLSDDKALSTKLLWLQRILKRSPELEQHFFNHML
jgi:tRNA (guanosine-2'-O-)-methyltransferase